MSHLARPPDCSAQRQTEQNKLNKLNGGQQYPTGGWILMQTAAAARTAEQDATDACELLADNVTATFLFQNPAVVPEDEGTPWPRYTACKEAARSKDMDNQVLDEQQWFSSVCTCWAVAWPARVESTHRDNALLSCPPAECRPSRTSAILPTLIPRRDARQGFKLEEFRMETWWAKSLFAADCTIALACTSIHRIAFDYPSAGACILPGT